MDIVEDAICLSPCFTRSAMNAFKSKRANPNSVVIKVGEKVVLGRTSLNIPFPAISRRHFDLSLQYASESDKSFVISLRCVCPNGLNVFSNHTTSKEALIPLQSQLQREWRTVQPASGSSSHDMYVSIGDQVELTISDSLSLVYELVLCTQSLFQVEANRPGDASITRISLYHQLSSYQPYPMLSSAPLIEGNTHSSNNSPVDLMNYNTIGARICLGQNARRLSQRLTQSSSGSPSRLSKSPAARKGREILDQSYAVASSIVMNSLSSSLKETSPYFSDLNAASKKTESPIRLDLATSPETKHARNETVVELSPDPVPSSAAGGKKPGRKGKAATKASVAQTQLDDDDDEDDIVIPASKRSTSSFQPTILSSHGSLQKSVSITIGDSDSESGDEVTLSQIQREVEIKKKEKRLESLKHFERQLTFSSEEEITCAICRFPVSDDAAVPSGCAHLFCFECISAWTLLDSRCCVCKERMDSLKRYQRVSAESMAGSSGVLFDFVDLVDVRFQKQKIADVEVEDRRLARQMDGSFVDVEESSMDSISAINWRCQRCFTEEDPARLMCCDGCEKTWHIYCLTPPLSEVPASLWICQSCDILRMTQYNNIPRPLFVDKRQAEINARKIREAHERLTNPTRSPPTARLGASRGGGVAAAAAAGRSTTARSTGTSFSPLAAPTASTSRTQSNRNQNQNQRSKKKRGNSRYLDYSIASSYGTTYENESNLSSFIVSDDVVEFDDGSHPWTLTPRPQTRRINEEDEKLFIVDEEYSDEERVVSQEVTQEVEEEAPKRRRREAQAQAQAPQQQGARMVTRHRSAEMDSLEEPSLSWNPSRYARSSAMPVLRRSGR
jgi:PHD-finger